MKWQRTYTNRTRALRDSRTASFPPLPGCRSSCARILPSAAILATLSVLFLSGCASAPRTAAGDPSLPEIDVLQLKENSDEALKLAQETKLEVQTLTAKVNELEGRVSALGDEVAGLPLTKLEELTQQVALVSEQLRILEDRLNKVPAGAPGGKKELPTFSPTAIDTAKGKPSDLPPPASGKPATAAKPAEQAPKVKRKPNASDVEAALYKQGFDLFYARDHGKAIDRFEELLKKFPKGTYADNCLYWIGECHFAMGNFAKAVAAFNQVLAYAESEKADDAQLKLGYCYLRLGERKRAAAEFKKVVSLYPESEYTERAKEELAKLE
jgi:tol-pal system protein YbgF